MRLLNWLIGEKLPQRDVPKVSAELLKMSTSSVCQNSIIFLETIEAAIRNVDGDNLSEQDFENNPVLAILTLLHGNYDYIYSTIQYENNYLPGESMYNQIVRNLNQLITITKDVKIRVKLATLIRQAEKIQEYEVYMNDKLNQ